MRVRLSWGLTVVAVVSGFNGAAGRPRCTLTLGRLVSGPVLLGAGRYHGLGLLRAQDPSYD